MLPAQAPLLRSFATQERAVQDERRAGPETIRCRSASEGHLRIMSATFRSGLTGAEKFIPYQRASRVRVPPKRGIWIGASITRFSMHKLGWERCNLTGSRSE